jgi:hypothetical protein
MSSVWRCRVCEGVNQGGRTCAICGAVVPRGESVRAAVRTRLPSTLEPAPAPVPPTTGRRELRQWPTPDEMSLLEPDEMYAAENGFNIRPLPGGCLFTFGPKRFR